MKQLKNFIIFLLCCLPVKMAIADSGGNMSSSSSPNRTILSQKNNSSQRPHAPARDFIVCQYGIQYIEFIFPNNVSSLTVQIYNDTDSWTGFVTVEEPIIETPIFEGEYTIQCTTNDGRTFNGMIEF